MKRNFLFGWYQTPRGKLLKELEADYLQKSITVSCQQIILQIGGRSLVAASGTWRIAFLAPHHAEAVFVQLLPALLTVVVGRGGSGLDRLDLPFKLPHVCLCH